jgi:hypothetical protein
MEPGRTVYIKRDLFIEGSFEDKMGTNFGTKEKPIWLPTGKVIRKLTKTDYLCQVGPHQLAISYQEVYKAHEFKDLKHKKTKRNA